jgi:hypothetical protein
MCCCVVVSCCVACLMLPHRTRPDLSPHLVLRPFRHKPKLQPTTPPNLEPSPPCSFDAPDPPLPAATPRSCTLPIVCSCYGQVASASSASPALETPAAKRHKEDRELAVALAGSYSLSGWPLTIPPCHFRAGLDLSPAPPCAGHPELAPFVG